MTHERKHLLADKYPVLAGFVQTFKDKDTDEPKPPVVKRDANGQTVRDFTVKALGSQKLVRVTVWPEFEHVHIDGDSFVIAEGKFKQSEGKSGQTFLNLDSTIKLAVIQGAKRAEAEVVNKKDASDVDDDDAPF